MSYIASWSGGKDSCLALYRTLGKGYRISHLVNFISREFHRVNFHGTKAELIRLQSQAIGIQLRQKETTPDSYERDFQEAIHSLLTDEIEGMVFGDIYLPEHREWGEKVCGKLGIQSIEPLWNESTADVLSSFLDIGFQAVIISARSDLIDQDWVGRKIDRSFMDYLQKKNIDFCGENGEYHTFVVDGPIFKKPIHLINTNTILREGRWLLDTISYQLGH